MFSALPYGGAPVAAIGFEPYSRFPPSFSVAAIGFSALPYGGAPVGVALAGSLSLSFLLYLAINTERFRIPDIFRLLSACGALACYRRGPVRYFVLLSCGNMFPRFSAHYLSAILINDQALLSLKQGCMSLGFTQSLASNLQKLSKLQSIRLDGCPVTSAGLKAIANSCSSLKELSLS
uniref:Uncharacterized protein n=1 Tax=Ananas comosus var. bracteatus TaxID=296719 RepID=A0A6V7QSD9_ANACO